MLLDHNGNKINTRKYDGTKREFSPLYLATLIEVLETEEKTSHIPGQPFMLRHRVHIRKRGCSEVTGENRETIINQLQS